MDRAVRVAAAGGARRLVRGARRDGVIQPNSAYPRRRRHLGRSPARPVRRISRCRTGSDQPEFRGTGPAHLPGPGRPRKPHGRGRSRLDPDRPRHRRGPGHPRAAGAVLVTADGAWFAAAPPIVARSTVGAGDWAWPATCSPIRGRLPRGSTSHRRRLRQRRHRVARHRTARPRRRRPRGRRLPTHYPPP